MGFRQKGGGGEGGMIRIGLLARSSPFGLRACWRCGSNGSLILTNFESSNRRFPRSGKLGKVAARAATGIGGEGGIRTFGVFFQ